MALKNLSPTKTSSWKELKAHYEKMKNTSLKELFEKNSKRAKEFSLFLDEGFLVDFSKNHIDSHTLELLIKLAKECYLEESIKKMFGGEPINFTEKRAVLHTALRNPVDKPIYLDGGNIMPQIGKVLGQMKDFSQKILDGKHKGYSEKKITDVVNVGIGGSDLGPLMVCEALKQYKTHLNLHFVSNVDGAHIYETLKGLNPETTLFIIASKTFTTQETMSNAQSAKKWFLEKARDENHIAKHFVALSTNSKKVKEFGIDLNNQFEFWDWVGGRYSLWGAIGLSICLGVGYENFKELLIGAHEVDEHFKNTPLEKNIPVLLALVGIWYRNFFSASTYGIFPYCQYLHRFPAYLQQLDMESNGKSIDRCQASIKSYNTGPVIWGEVGTNGQHSFYQLLHQGTELIPCDFITFAKDLSPNAKHHTKLLSHFFAQSQALAFGKSLDEVIAQLKFQGKSDKEIKELSPFKVFEGNKPSNSILIKELNPRALGKLIAIYEHKVFTQGVIWNIFSFDQWGVELGKELSSSILEKLQTKKEITKFDSSTNSLINYYNKMKND